MTVVRISSREEGLLAVRNALREGTKGIGIGMSFRGTISDFENKKKSTLCVLESVKPDSAISSEARYIGGGGNYKSCGGYCKLFIKFA